MTVGLNRAKMTTSTTGTGTITLGSAVTGYATLAEAGAVNAATYTYCIEDGNDFEIGTGTYTSSGTTLSRDTVTLSKISGTAGTSKISLSGSATVFITAGAADLLAAATQTLMEAEASAAYGVTPAVAHYAPSAVKTWINFNGTGTPAIRVSRNASSITDNSTGDWTINFTTSFSSGNYAVGAFCRDNDAESRGVISQDGSTHMVAGSLRVVATGNSVTKFDSDRVTAMMSGDF